MATSSGRAISRPPTPDHRPHPRRSDRSAALEAISREHRDRGDLTTAGPAFEESLAVSRPLRGALGESPEAPRDLSVSLVDVGDLKRLRKDNASARCDDDEALALVELVSQRFGARPQWDKDRHIVLARSERLSASATRGPVLHGEVTRCLASSRGVLRGPTSRPSHHLPTRPLPSTRPPPPLARRRRVWAPRARCRRRGRRSAPRTTEAPRSRRCGCRASARTRRSRD